MTAATSTSLTEREFTIILSDGHHAYARLYGDWRQPLIVFVHGLGESMDTILPHEAAHYFAQQSFSWLSFNLYDWRPQGRVLTDCTLALHARDLDQVIAYARHQGAPAIHVAGHSYGGLTILFSAHQKFASAILLDPSHPEVTPFQTLYIQEIDRYSFRGGVDMLLGPAMVDEIKTLQPNHFLSRYHRPTLIVSAGSGFLVEAGRDYALRLTPHLAVEHVIISGANHGFTTPTARHDAFTAMATWLQAQPEAT